MSDLPGRSRRMPLAALGAASGFRADARFSGEPPPAPPVPEPEDPLALAWAEGHAAGIAEEAARRQATREADEAVRQALALSFTRLDRALEEELRLRLRDTVAALCEAAITPLALDEAALAARVEKAAAMLARADDERVIRLHPDDLLLVGPRLAEDWDVAPDATLERGSVRIESANGGVEDGPAIWRRAISEALQQC